MFNYPNEKPRAVAGIEQRCYACHHWFTLATPVVRELVGNWVKAYQQPAAFFAFTMCKCANCGQEQIAPLIGKYDKPGWAKSRCSLQHVILKGA